MGRNSSPCLSLGLSTCRQEQNQERVVPAGRLHLWWHSPDATQVAAVVVAALQEPSAQNKVGARCARSRAQACSWLNVGAGSGADAHILTPLHTRPPGPGGGDCSEPRSPAAAPERVVPVSSVHASGLGRVGRQAEWARGGAPSAGVRHLRQQRSRQVGRVRSGERAESVTRSHVPRP